MKAKFKKGDLAIVKEFEKFKFIEFLGLKQGDIIVVDGTVKCQYQDSISWPCSEACMGKIKFHAFGSSVVHVSCMCNQHGCAVSKTKYPVFLGTRGAKSNKSRRKKCE